MWYSSRKAKNDSLIYLDKLKEIRLGQDTATFKNYRLPMLEHLSFSVLDKFSSPELKNRFYVLAFISDFYYVLFHDDDLSPVNLLRLSHSQSLPS